MMSSIMLQRCLRMSASARKLSHHLTNYARSENIGAMAVSRFQYGRDGGGKSTAAATLGVLAAVATAVNIGADDGKAKCSGIVAAPVSMKEREMKDREIGVIHAEGHILGTSSIGQAPDQDLILSPDPYPHWTIKTFLEQPEAIARALGFGTRLCGERVQLGGLDSYLETVSKIKYMTLSACGTSLNAARYAEKLMKNLGSFDRVISTDATCTDAKDFPITADPKESGLIVLSREAKDVISLVDTAMEKDMTVVSVENSVGGFVAHGTAKHGVCCGGSNGNNVESTESFATQVTVLALVALWFRQTRDMLHGTSGSSVEASRLEESLMRLPITFGMSKKSREQCKKIAGKMKDKEHCFVLGKGYGEPVAMEGALKIKEISSLHAEGYSGGALKHGPFALIEDQNGKFGSTPIILVILDDSHAHHMRTAAEEVKARGADVIIITDNQSLADGLDEDPIILQENGPLTALGAVLPLQLIAYELALLRGINPDTPRNITNGSSC